MKEIKIGREPENGRLQVQVGTKIGYIGNQGCVPQSVSRKDHCKIMVDDSGAMTIQNGGRNVTYVDGVQVDTKAITMQSRVELGKDYVLDLAAVFAAVKKIEGPKTYSIAHLEEVWNRYEKDLLDMQVRQAKRANRQRLQGVFSLMGTAFLFVESLSVFRFVFVGIALLIAIVSFVQSSRSDNVLAIQQNKRKHQFEEEYVCPNPECRAFKGDVRYAQLRHVHVCPSCQCKYTI